MADDDPEDILLTKEAIEEVAPDINFKSVAGGQELIDYLSTVNKGDVSVDKPCPGLVLLDLNMPRKNGFEVLSEMKNDPTWKSIPVLVLSTSQGEGDINRSYGLGANAFIPKPRTFDELLLIMEQTMNYWFQVIRLPSIC